jgi:FixJ family two-component response regulator
MNNAPFRVHLVDDDIRVLNALSRVLMVAGYGVEAFANAESFLEKYDPAVPGCAIIDLVLPGKDGFDVQDALAACGTPILFLSGQASLQAGVKAMKAGALDFLEKPVDADILLAAVEHARQIDDAARSKREERQEFDERFARLTPRERQVLDHVVAGRMNKQIAGDLGTVEKTIKVHRARMFGKMGVRTVAQLVRRVQRFRQQD